MNTPGPATLGYAFLLSELALTATLRSRGSGVRQDRSTLRMLWLVILLSVAAGIYLAKHFRAGGLPNGPLFSALGFALFVIGLLLRWWAIITLGRFFTVDVQIAKDHELVERGPFRILRHPSYTGVLLAFAAFAFSVGNWAAILVILLPIFAVFIHRMNVEEQPLTSALGETYVAYKSRTKRLLPFVY